MSRPGHLSYASVPGSYRSNFYTPFVRDLQLFDPSLGYNPTTGITYAITNRIVQAQGMLAPQMLVYPGLIQTEWAAATFNATDPQNTISGSSQPNLGGNGQSNPGFAQFGGFGNPPPGSINGATAAGPATVKLGGTPGATVSANPGNGSQGSTSFGDQGGANAAGGVGNVSGTTVNFGGQPNTSASGGTANGSGTGVNFGGLSGGSASGAAGNGFQLPAAGTLPPLPGGSEGGSLRPTEVLLVDLQPVLDDIVALGSRPAAQADLGRGGAGAGFAGNVFRKRFQLARTLDDSLCGGADLQPATISARQC